MSTRSRRSATSRVAPSNPNIIYVGTGEPNNRQSSSFGGGVYKSTDGGKKFEYVGLKETQTHRPHRRAPEGSRTSSTSRRSATCSGRTPSAALYKTTDGGKTWTNTKFIDNDTGFIDVVMDPDEPEHAVRRVVSAPAAAVGIQRRRPRQRHLADDRRAARPGRSSRATACRTIRSSAASASTSPVEADDIYAPIEVGPSGGTGAGVNDDGTLRSPGRDAAAVAADGRGASAAAPRPIRRRAASGAPTTAARRGGS